MTAERLNKSIRSGRRRDVWPLLELIKPWFSRYVGWGFALSLLVHIIAFCVLSIVLYDRIAQGPIGTTFGLGGGGDGGGGGEGGGELEQLLDTRVDLAGSDELVAEVPQFEPAQLARPNFATGSAASVKGPGGGGTGEGDGWGPGTGGFRFSMPGDGRAVIKGNFAAWTEPKDPKPGEPYKIIIQIKLPRNVRAYPLSDLSGLVEGTDQYVQTIPYSVRETLPVIDHQTQLIVDVPGARELVKDTITVRSRMLREKQELEIEF